MNLNNEYNEFLNHHDQSNTNRLDKTLQLNISNDLKLYPLFLFSKVIFIHLIVALATLTFCPQFGIGPFGGEFGITQSLMNYGHLFCATICAGIFFGFSTLSLFATLKPGELIFLNYHKFSFFSGLAILSLLIFYFIGQSSDLNSGMNMLTLDYSLMWLVTGIIFSIFMVKVRQRLLKKYVSIKTT
ncbi:hypothetical protein BVY03_02305 [bacterium K02(2017)]|nr:hypothetical protein BVY03_02305 [bacterium K02(2017)]